MKSDEIGGDSYTAEFWEYDSRTGRRWNLDPKYNASESRYLVNGGNPIFYADPRGDFKTKFGAQWNKFWHGGNSVGKNKYDEWYVTKNISGREGQKGSGNVNDEVIVGTERYYGKGRDKYSTAKENLLREIEIDNDIMMKGDKSMYQYYNSQEEMNKATLSYTGLLLPTALIRPLTIATAVNNVKAIINIPKGFSSAEQFTQVGNELKTALQESNIPFSNVGVRGSAVTNISSKGGEFREVALGVKKASDIDVYVELTQQVGLNSSKNIPGFIHPGKMMERYPALQQWAEKWSKILGREITPGAFNPGTFSDANVIKF
jgi:hypothetical protein